MSSDTGIVSPQRVSAPVPSQCFASGFPVGPFGSDSVFTAGQTRVMFHSPQVKRCIEADHPQVTDWSSPTASNQTITR